MAWLIWGLGATLFCYGFFQRVAPSVMIDPLMRDFAVSGAVLGNLSAFYFYAYASLQIPVGLMVDRWGPRRMLAFGATLCALGTLVFATAESLLVAYAARLMVGAGAGCSFVGTLKLATNWFPASRFAQLTGLTMMAGMIGGIGGQAPLAALVELAGWRGALLGSGALGLALALSIWLIVRDSPNGTNTEAAASDTAKSLLKGLGEVFSLPRNWMICLVGASMTAPMLSFAGLWGVAWLMQTGGMARAEAAATTSLLLIGWAAGSPLAGYVSDRLGRRKLPLLLGALLGLACLSALLYLRPGGPFAALLFLLAGVGLGAMAICFAMMREINPAENTGAAYGFLNGCVVGTGAIFQPLIGALLDSGWDGKEIDGARLYSEATYETAFSVLVAFLILGFLVSCTLSETGAAKGKHPK